MTRPTFLRCMEHVEHFVKQGTQAELNLTGVGESQLNPEFDDFCKIARETVDRAGGRDRVLILITTNGIHMTDEAASKLAALGIGVFVSLHRPEKAGLAVEHCKRHKILLGVSNDPSIAATTWANQVPGWFISAKPGRECPWIRKGLAFARSDGFVTSCCLPADDSGNVAHVDDPVGSLLTKPNEKLCRSCDQEISVTGYQQYAD